MSGKLSNKVLPRRQGEAPYPCLSSYIRVPSLASGKQTVTCDIRNFYEVSSHHC